MAQFHMGDFVCHYTGQLSLSVSSLQNAAVDVNEPTRQRERVDGTVVDELELILKIMVRRVRRQAATQAVQIGVDSRVVQHGNLALSVAGNLPAELGVLLRRKQVPARLQLRAFRPSQRRQRKEHSHDHGYHLLQVSANLQKRATLVWEACLAQVGNASLS